MFVLTHLPGIQVKCGFWTSVLNQKLVGKIKPYLYVKGTFLPETETNSHDGRAVVELK